MLSKLTKAMNPINILMAFRAAIFVAVVGVGLFAASSAEAGGLGSGGYNGFLRSEVSCSGGQATITAKGTVFGSVTINSLSIDTEPDLADVSTTSNTTSTVVSGVGVHTAIVKLDTTAGKDQVHRYRIDLRSNGCRVSGSAD